MGNELKPGLYERVVDQALAGRLDATSLTTHRRPLGASEAARRIAQTFQAYLQRALDGVPEAADRAAEQVRICNQLIDGLGRAFPDFVRDDDQLRAELLVAVGDLAPAPRVPLSESALFINGQRERRIGVELAREFASADRVDLICPFLFWAGFNELRPVIERHREAGRSFRLLTTTYRGATEPGVLEKLAELGVDIRVSYNTQATRLHAKAWLFHRDSGYSTAFIGSSNLSKSALTSGLEWNVRLSMIENRGVLEEFAVAFENYWNDNEFQPFDPVVFAEHLKAERHSDHLLTTFALRPFPFQREILDALEAARTEQDRHKNLVVAATGTGKTVMAALDYARLGDRPSLLFVAHRREILRKSRDVFRHAVGDGSFGELLVDGEVPSSWRHVFASVQSLASQDVESWPRDRYDVVIIDEFHHASRENRGYETLLRHLQPRELVGLTATPERTDGVDILHWFGGEATAEVRLWDAIDRGLLVPFQYFAVHDGTDLSEVSWRGGRYDAKALEGIYTGNTARAHLVFAAISRYVDVPRKMRAIGFCAGVSHAREMAEAFIRAGLPAASLTGATPSKERDRLIAQLAAGDLCALFTVDVFNEGVDIPAIDTVLFLRPTESALLFTQQLGRGLRRAEKKRCLTVLDFVGHPHKSFRYDRRLNVMARQGRVGLRRAVEEDFPFLPAGCAIQLDGVSREIILENLRQGIGSDKRSLIAELREQEQRGPLSLARFLREAELELADLYRGGRCFTDLLHALGACEPLPSHASARRAIGRLIHVDDVRRLSTWQALLDGRHPRDEGERRLGLMLLATVAPEYVGDLTAGLRWLREDATLTTELAALFALRRSHIDHRVIPWPSTAGVPLAVHARYSLQEIMAAFDDIREGQLYLPREGVYFHAPTACNLLFVTLDKDPDDYSATTNYRDYALSPDRFHWQSQSRTRPEDKRGQRHVRHADLGITPLLFVRERKKDDRGETQPYMLLGPATLAAWVDEAPMNIEWRLSHAMPAGIYRTAAAVAR